MDLPDIKNKKEAVDYELQFPIDYCEYEIPESIGDDLNNVDNFVEKWGKKVMKIEGKYLTKYKTIWNRSQL
jgi:hypothetical protein